MRHQNLGDHLGNLFMRPLPEAEKQYDTAGIYEEEHAQSTTPGQAQASGQSSRLLRALLVLYTVQSNWLSHTVWLLALLCKVALRK